MLKISRLIASLLMTVALAVPAVAEDVGRMRLPVLKDVQVKFQLVFNSRSGLYEYIYTVSNPSTNTGEIWKIYIDISRPPDSMELSSEGFLIPYGATTESFDESMAFFEDFPGGYVRMVPVGIKPPSGWRGSLMARGAASFSVDEDRGGKDILPGDTFTDLKLISYGLPTIRQIVVDPWWMYVQSADLTDEEAEEEDKRAREIEASVPVQYLYPRPDRPSCRL